MQPGPTALSPAADADRSASQEVLVARARPRWRRFAALGLAAYLAALLADLPARVVLDWGPRWQIAGTVWSGEGVLDGAYRLTWRWAPLRSLAAFAYAADVQLTGSGTDIAASAIAGPRRLRLDGVSGRGDGALLAALAPGLPFACDAPLEIDLPRLVLAGADSAAVGEIRSGSGSCGAAGAPGTSALPPLLLSARAAPRGGTVAELAPVGQARLRLIEGSVLGGRLTVRTTPLGAATLPFARGFAIDRAL